MSLDKFIALLALDPEKRQGFLADPETALKAAGLTSPQVQALTGNLESICKVLAAHDFPGAPDNKEGTGQAR